MFYGITRSDFKVEIDNELRFIVSRNGKYVASGNCRYYVVYDGEEFESDRERDEVTSFIQENKKNIDTHW